MSHDDGSTIGTSLVVFLLGVAVGVTVAILYAPMPGKETRAKVAESAGKIRERAAEIAHEVTEKAKDIRDRVTEPEGKGEGEPPVLAEGESAAPAPGEA